MARANIPLSQQLGTYESGITNVRYQPQQTPWCTMTGHAKETTHKSFSSPLKETIKRKLQQHQIATPIPACLQSSTIDSSLNNCNCHGTSWNHTYAPCLVRATSGPFHMSAKSKSSGYFQPSSSAKVQLNSEAMVTQIRMKAQNERSRGAQTCDLCATSNFQQLSPP